MKTGKDRETFDVMLGSTVTISKDEYNRLLKSSRKLEALEGYGVDNWQCYDDAMTDIYAEENDDE